MPILPELALTCDDLLAFDKMLSRRHNEEMTDEFLEAYKYVYSKPGLAPKFHPHLIWYHKIEFFFLLQALLPVESITIAPIFHAPMAIKPVQIHNEKLMVQMVCLY